MQLDDLTPERARELAKPVGWTVQALLDKLPRVSPRWMRMASGGCQDRRLLSSGLWN